MLTMLLTALAQTAAAQAVHSSSLVFGQADKVEVTLANLAGAH